MQTVISRRHWAHAPDLMPVTIDGAESYHGHLNADFNAPRPNIYIFVEALLRQQAATYVTVSFLLSAHCQSRGQFQDPYV